ncbi:uncharacterized protein LOC142343117 [Convolutriloba macropyga]|uniref:uncharacterized protein LOC142343117 n=1 Tax=Convolutriloba macropyga TaxID=536237 RepID=UPI003F51E8E6
MTLWHVPHPATVTSSHPQQFQQQVLQTNLNKPVVSYSSGGTTYYKQNPFSTATFIGQHSPASSLTVQQGLYSNPMLPYATMPANTTGPFHSYNPSTSVAPAHDNSFNVKDLADAITSSQLNPLPKWTLAQYNGDTLLWHEWIGQFKIAIDSQNLSDAAKLTYLKTLLTGRAKKSIEQFAYSGALNCPNPRKCKQPGCASTHNILLHGSERIFTKNNAKKPSETKNVTDPPQSTSLVTLNSENICTPNQDGNSSSFPAVSDVKGLLQVKEVQLKGPTAKETKVLALCDPACSHSWIAASAAARLNLKGSPLKLTVCGINAKQVIDTLITDVTVKPLGDNTCESFDVSPYIRDTLNVGSDIINVPQLQETYPYLSVLDPVQYSYSNVEMILGQDVYHAIRPIEYFESDSKCAPVAVRLPIGWVLSGPLPATSSFISSCFKIVTEPETDLAEQLKSWYDMESYGAVKEVDPRSSSDRRAVEILEKTTFNDGKRYQVGMLWSKDDLPLPNNYYSALVQLKSLEKRLFRDQDLRVKYEKSIKDDVDKGYVVQVLNPKDPSERSRREWYLPHHPVVNPNKPNKMRRVLNGAAKFHGTSLNKSLLTGPDLLQRLIHTLIRFRQYQYAVSADIEGMFLQVGVLPQDQPCLRFLWREDPSTDVMVYQYTRHIFGAKDSPTCANYTLQRTAKDNSRQYPDASQAVLEKFYMDDYLDSLDEPEKALKRAKELVELLMLGGFKLTKFVSSVPHLLDELDNSFKTNDQEEPKVIGSSEEEASSHWLRSFDKQPIFVANRVSEILESTTVDQWFHVPSTDNPADAGTRGMSADGLCASSWLKGPIFLFTSDFPFQPKNEILGNLKKPLTSPLGDPVQKQESSLASNVSYEEKLFDYKKFSSYFKLVRITAYFLRILPKHAHFRSSDASILRPDELQVAEAKLQFLVQSESFPLEKKQLLDEKHLIRKSPISPYTPFIGPNALIRSSGRIKLLVEADYDIKHPIILDSRHPASSLFCASVLAVGKSGLRGSDISARYPLCGGYSP